MENFGRLILGKKSPNNKYATFAKAKQQQVYEINFYEIILASSMTR